MRVARAMTTTRGADLMCLMFMTVYLLCITMHRRGPRADIGAFYIKPGGRRQMCACGMCCCCCYAMLSNKICMPFLTTTR